MAAEGSVERRAGTSRGSAWRLWTGLIAAAVALFSLGVTLWFGEALVSSVPTLRQPSPFVKWGTPVAQLAIDAAGTLTVGWLLLAALFVPAEDNRLSAQGQRSLRAAAICSVAWALAAFALAVFSIADLLGITIIEAISGGALLGYFVNLPDGWALFAVLVITGTLSVAAHLPRTVVGAGYLLVAAVIGLTPRLIFVGHAADSSYHTLAVYTLVGHVVAAAAWVGGLVAMILAARWLGDRLVEILPRYSRLALACFTVVGICGLVNGWIRLDGLNFDSRYGVLVLAKTAALAVLAAFGWWHRRASIPALRTERRTRTFARVAAVETIIMAATIALAVGLSRSPTPLPGGPTETAAKTLLGFELPPAPGPAALALDWWIDPVTFTLVLAGALFYAVGLLRLRRQRGTWPLAHTLAWYAGLALVLVAANGGLARYSMVIFSAHMVQHLVLSLLAPVMLVLGAPLTLALRTLRGEAGPTGRNPREFLRTALHGRSTRILAHPLVAYAILIITLYGFYFTPIFEITLRDHVLHSITMVVFVIAGVLAFWSGFTPRAGLGSGVVTRLLLALAPLPAHLLVGTALMRWQHPLAISWYQVFPRTWGFAPLQDQQVGGWLAAIMGTALTLLAVSIIGVQAFRDHRARRAPRLRPGRPSPGEPSAPRPEESSRSSA